MIDLGVNGGVVLALAIALFLFGRHEAGQELSDEEDAALPKSRWG